jgi:ribonuclease P protein component
MQTFTKAERLSGKTALDKLFTTGHSFNSFPFKVIWLETNDGMAPAQIVISVPKRIYKRAVDRNRLKRLIREVYRKNKEILYHQLESKKLHLLLIYTSKTAMDYKEMNEKIIIVLQRLTKTVHS